MLEADCALIYVPEDDDRYCRIPTYEDLRIARRMDALAALPPGVEGAQPCAPEHVDAVAEVSAQLGCMGDAAEPNIAGYRSGRCQCCDCCPHNWSAVELYSEHYRCAARNGLKVTQCSVDLGVVYVGEMVHQPAQAGLPNSGFMQCPTLVRLPPGVRFADDGSLAGQV